jgi:ribosomal protein S11
MLALLGCAAGRAYRTDRFVLMVAFHDDEHAPTAALADKTLQTVNIRDPTPIDPDCPRKR